VSTFSRPPRSGDPLATAQRMRDVDARAAAEFGVPGAVLMESAGRGCVERIERLAAEGRVARAATVVCGPGNNGGDGCVIARTLVALGWSVRAHLVGEPARFERLSSEAQLHLDLARRCGVEFQAIGHARDLAALERELAGLAAKRGLVVDALFGTGLGRPLDGLFAAVIGSLAACHATVFAVDLPSGLDADTGAVRGAAVSAHFTSTLAALKPGLFAGSGPSLCGELELVEIGLPAELLAGLPRHQG
jgi:NAD(P)H-hydrate epimerase